jgi:hypothetical protein
MAGLPHFVRSQRAGVFFDFGRFLPSTAAMPVLPAECQITLTGRVRIPYGWGGGRLL